MPVLSERISRRLLPLLQLTRMALVFTAIADSLCSLLLRAQRTRLALGGRILDYIDPMQAGALVVISIGLYGFGMSLNDIIDRRRDRRLAAHRPLPSGRIGVMTAHITCFLLASAAFLAGAVYARRPIPGSLASGWASLVLVVFTLGLIAFYDFAGKYLVWPGLLSLGLIRFFHAAIAAPELPLLWQPLWLLNHVTILSTVAYAWEEKRPALTKNSCRSVVAGLAIVNAVVIGWVAWRRCGETGATFERAMWVHAGLLLPAAAALWFIVTALFIHRRNPSRRDAGQKLMLYGLLWLIVYDASFAAGYVGWIYGLALLMLLPLAWACVQLMRWWNKLAMISQTPQYRRKHPEDESPPA